MATIMLPLSLEKLTNESDMVVLGNCTGKNVVDQGGKIYTEYTIQVNETLKGAALKEVKVRQLGGEINGRGLYVAGVAKFTPAEEVMVFLTKDSNGLRDVVGWAQGKFHIYYDDQTKKKYAMQQMEGLSLAKKGSGEISEPSTSKVEVTVLKAQVKAIVTKKAAGK